MKLNILLGVVLLATCLAVAEGEQTVLTYIIEHEIDQSDHFVQLELSVNTVGKSLKATIADAARVIAKIQKIAKAYCLQGKSKQQCEGIVEATKYQVEPKYHLVRKIQTFTLFIVSHQVTVNIKNLKSLGKMIDQIILESEGLATLNKFSWKANEQLDPQRETLKEGISQGRQLCDKLGKTLTEFISVEQLQAPPINENDEEQEQRDEDLAEQEIELTIFRFKVKCGEDKKTGKAKVK